MGIFSELRNECLIRELDRELNNDVVLFGFDGFSYFGNLQGIEDCRIAILAPARVSGVSDVEIQTPGGEVENVSFSHVDLWQVIGKATAIAHDPLACDPEKPRPEEVSAAQRQESHCLIHQLRRMLGECVTITTLGGFLFVGTLSEVRHELAFLTVDEIVIPGTTSSISSRDARSAVVNLEAITSVSSENSCSHHHR